MKSSGHGGWRPGAGARPIPEAERLVPLSIRITRDLIDRLIELDPSGKQSAAVAAREIVLAALEEKEDALKRRVHSHFAESEAKRLDMEARRVWQVSVERGFLAGHYLVPSSPLVRRSPTSEIPVGQHVRAFDRDSNVEYEVEVTNGADVAVRVLRKIGSLPMVKKVVPMSRHVD